MEQISVQGIQFVLQVILARLLAPEHYGTLSLMLVFTSLATVFVQTGFNTALIQNKDTKTEDYSSVFWVSEFIALILYVIIFISAPYIANIYGLPDIIRPLRIISLMLFPGAINSIQLAKIRRELNFKKVFKCNIIAVIVSGILGIVVAYLGGGLWALVCQQLTNVITVCIVMWFTVDWHPILFCDFKRVKVFFSFGWKLLVSSLIETLYQDINGIIVGVKYNSSTLGYYNRGKHFPQFVNRIVNSTVQAVMLPAMSAEQDDRNKAKELMRNSIAISAYVMFPAMAGLAGVAPALIELLLTDKWLPSVPYMQIYCFSFAFYPVHSCNLQAINAMGRSDIYLKLEIIKKSYGLIALVIALFCFDSPLAIAGTGLVTTWISWFVNSYPNKKLIQYSYFEQITDVLPSMIMSLTMCGFVISLNILNINIILKLIIQVIVGLIVYLLLSLIIKPKAFTMLLCNFKSILKR